MTLEEIATKAMELPSEARALFADRLVQSLNVAEVNRIEQFWVTETKRRYEQVRQGREFVVAGDVGAPEFRSPEPQPESVPSG